MANNPKHKENLKNFTPGFDPRRNVEGAPKKLPVLATITANVLGDEKDGLTAAETILMVQRNKAVKGDLAAAKWLFEQGFGLPTQKHDINGDLNLNIDDARNALLQKLSKEQE